MNQKLLQWAVHLLSADLTHVSWNEYTAAYNAFMIKAKAELAKSPIEPVEYREIDSPHGHLSVSRWKEASPNLQNMFQPLYAGEPPTKEGFVPVPVEPTLDMIAAATVAARPILSAANFTLAYRAMIEAVKE